MRLRVSTLAESTLMPVRTGLLQRNCSCGQHTVMGHDCAACSQGSLQRAPRSAARGSQQVPPIVHDVLRSSGQPLDAATRAFMEPRLGHDFGRVRVHSDGQAAASAHAVDALAYTVGPQVVFGGGQYSPQSTAGRALIAHELTHVVQQQATTGSQGGLISREANDAAEQEADHVARGISAGATPVVGRNQIALQRNGKKVEAAQVPAWTPAQLGVIQTQLKKLGLYPFTVDRLFGDNTENALVEAFGGDEWRKLSPDELIKRLQGAKPPAGKAAEHNLRYGELFKDGLLDVSMGVGFQEDGWGKTIAQGLKKSLADRDFKEDRSKAEKIYKATGQELPRSAFGLFFVWNKTISYTPPAAAERKVDVIVRLISNADDKHGADAAGAFKEGMRQSDIAFYSGHGRVGSGPDFDMAMRIELFDKDGKSEAVFDDYEKFEEKLKADQKTKDEGVIWKHFQWLLSHNRVKVTGDNAGNIFMNPNNPHPGEFLAKLMYWNLTRKTGTGAAPATPVTGTTGELNQSTPRKYRIWVFNGCRTEDYVRSIRSTPALDPKSTDLMVTTRITYWSDYGNTMMAFLDSVLKQQSAEKVIKEMDATHVTDRPAGEKGLAVRAEGLSDNPVIPK
jgi:Domain of unknown function (DUF4157)